MTKSILNIKKAADQFHKCLAENCKTSTELVQHLVIFNFSLLNNLSKKDKKGEWVDYFCELMKAVEGVKFEDNGASCLASET